MEMENKTIVMGSQADDLSQMVGKRIITITSSKSGGGQTSIILNLAIKLVEDNNRVLILDATDERPPAIYALSESLPRLTLKHVLTDESITIEKAIASSEYGVDFLKSGALYPLVGEEQITADFIEKLKWHSQNLQNSHDVILVDVGVLHSPQSLHIALATPETVMIVSPDVPSRVCCYMTMKHIAKHTTDNSCIRLLVNMATDETQAQQIAEGVIETSEKFLSESLLSIEYLGYIPLDINIIDAFYHQEPFVNRYPETQASSSIKSVAQKIEKEKPENLKPIILGEILSCALSVERSPINGETMTNNLEEQ